MWNRLLLLKAQLLGHEGIRRYGANTAWLMGEKVLRMFMGLFVGIWVARYLGPEQFGLLSYAQSFVFLFTAIATLGLDSIVVRELVKDNSQHNVLLGTAFTLKLIGSLCILPLLWLGVQFTSNDSYTNLLIFIIASGTIFQSFNVIDFYYQSSVLSKYVAFANTITLAISSIIKIVLILNQASLLAFAIVGVFDAIILSIGLIYFYWQKTKHSLREWRFDRVVAKRLLKDSWPLILSSIVVSLFMRIDQIMIKSILDNSSVGVYAAAIRLSEAWFFIPSIIVSTIFPSIVKSYRKGDILNIRLSILYSLIIWMGIIISIMFIVLGKYIIRYTFGDEYASSYYVLIVTCWSGIFAFLNVSSARWLIANNLPYILFERNLISLIINIAFNLILIQKIGILGAAISTLISFIYCGYIHDLFRSSTRNQFKLKTNALFFRFK